MTDLPRVPKRLEQQKRLPFKNECLRASRVALRAHNCGHICVRIAHHPTLPPTPDNAGSSSPDTVNEMGEILLQDQRFGHDAHMEMSFRHDGQYWVCPSCGYRGDSPPAGTCFARSASRVARRTSQDPVLAEIHKAINLAEQSDTTLTSRHDTPTI